MRNASLPHENLLKRAVKSTSRYVLNRSFQQTFMGQERSEALRTSTWDGVDSGVVVDLGGVEWNGERLKRSGREKTGERVHGVE